MGLPAHSVRPQGNRCQLRLGKDVSFLSVFTLRTTNADSNEWRDNRSRDSTAVSSRSLSDYSFLLAMTQDPRKMATTDEEGNAPM